MSSYPAFVSSEVCLIVFSWGVGGGGLWLPIVILFLCCFPLRVACCQRPRVAPGCWFRSDVFLRELLASAAALGRLLSDDQRPGGDGDHQLDSQRTWLASQKFVC